MTLIWLNIYFNFFNLFTIFCYQIWTHYAILFSMLSSINACRMQNLIGCGMLLCMIFWLFLQYEWIKWYKIYLHFSHCQVRIRFVYSRYFDVFYFYATLFLEKAFIMHIPSRQNARYMSYNLLFIILIMKSNNYFKYISIHVYIAVILQQIKWLEILEIFFANKKKYIYKKKEHVSTYIFLSLIHQIIYIIWQQTICPYYNT